MIKLRLCQEAVQVRCVRTDPVSGKEEEPEAFAEVEGIIIGKWKYEAQCQSEVVRRA